VDILRGFMRVFQFLSTEHHCHCPNHTFIHINQAFPLNVRSFHNYYAALPVPVSSFSLSSVFHPWHKPAAQLVVILE